MKRLLSLILAASLAFALVACGGKPTGNTSKSSSSGSTPAMEFEWQQPKINKIFDHLTADSLKDTGTFAMTLIQDGNQIESKMVQPGILDPFIPKDWANANNTTADTYDGFLPLQTLNKVFMYNNTGSKTYTNCWDFVVEGEHGLFMDIDSEIVGKNFLYMLTRDDYSEWLKKAFEALSAEEQAYFQPTINEMEAEVTDLGLGVDGKYALAWIKLWVESYNAQADDGSICNTLVGKSATDQFGLLVYSKLRSVEESSSVSVNNVNVASFSAAPCLPSVLKSPSIFPVTTLCSLTGKAANALPSAVWSFNFLDHLFQSSPLHGPLFSTFSSRGIDILPCRRLK